MRRLAGLVLVLLIIVAPIAAPTAAWAQELVLNPGFESFSRCPTGPGLVDGYADSWHRSSVASTDYQNTCGFSAHVPRTGAAHIGLLAYDFSPNYREYATGTLSAPLVAGRQYRFEMYAILDSGRLHAVAELGAYFSASSPTWPGTVPPAGIVPQVENASGLLMDKVDWMLVTGTFVAAGGEQYVTIGNFHDDASTTTFDFGCCGQYGAYYHLDDVSIVEAGAPPTCLYRADLTSLAPFAPPRSALFMPEGPDGISLQGTAYQCPIATGDDESDTAALSNGVPLSFYQVSLPAAVLRLETDSGTIRFTF